MSRFLKQNHPSRLLRLDIPSAVALFRRLSMTQCSYSVIQKTQSTFHMLYLPQYAVSHLVLIEATLPSWIHTDMKWVLFCLLWHSGGVQFASLFSTFFHSSAIQEHTITIITPAVSLIKINCYLRPLTMSLMADLHSCKSHYFSPVWELKGLCYLPILNTHTLLLFLVSHVSHKANNTFRLASKRLHRPIVQV